MFASGRHCLGIHSLSSTPGRYCYVAQPDVCHWNLERLAEALGQVCKPLKQRSRQKNEVYWEGYERELVRLGRLKLGLVDSVAVRFSAVRSCAL